MRKIETVFKVGDIVYDDTRYGKGIVRGIEQYSTANPLVVIVDFGTFDKGIRYTLDGRHGVTFPKTLSFAPYDLDNGGFTQDRSNIPIKRGALVYVKNHSDPHEWRIRFFYKKEEEGLGIQTLPKQKTIDDLNSLDYLEHWPIYTLKNPFEDVKC